MRAVVHDRYGPLEMLRLEEVERPKEHGVLVRVLKTALDGLAALARDTR